MMSRPRFKILLTILLILLGLWSIRTYNLLRYPMQKKTRFLMDTYVTISACGAPDMISQALDAALNRMQEIDIKFNALDAKSSLYAFNHEGVPITDKEILGLIRLGLRISQESGGAFDMTVAPLSELWGFYGPSPRLPQEQEIQKVLKSVGYRHLLFKEGKLVKDDKSVRIDLGGIAKGYALSEAVKILKAYGVESALIDAGGDVYVMGKVGMRSWNVGIRDPRGDGLAGYLSVEDLAVIGSGDYERCFIRDGKRYHHIFDPKTGYPTQGVASVTIIYKDPVVAQPWAKIPFVLGPKKGLEMLEKIPGMEVIVILTSGEKLYSRGLKHPLRSSRVLSL